MGPSHGRVAGAAGGRGERSPEAWEGRPGEDPAHWSQDSEGVSTCVGVGLFLVRLSQTLCSRTVFWGLLVLVSTLAVSSKALPQNVPFFGVEPDKSGVKHVSMEVEKGNNVGKLFDPHGRNSFSVTRWLLAGSCCTWPSVGLCSSTQTVGALCGLTACRQGPVPWWV